MYAVKKHKQEIQKLIKEIQDELPVLQKFYDWSQHVGNETLWLWNAIGSIQPRSVSLESRKIKIKLPRTQKQMKNQFWNEKKSKFSWNFQVFS